MTSSRGSGFRVADVAARGRSGLKYFKKGHYIWDTTRDFLAPTKLLSVKRGIRMGSQFVTLRGVSIENIDCCHVYPGYQSH